jgi:phenylacetate-CoA ligase
MFRDRDVECMPRRELEAVQLSKLRQMLVRAHERVPAYRRKIDQTWVAADRLTGLSQLRELPFTTKQELWEQYPFGLLATPLEHVVRLHASSGTRGKPTLVGYTRRDLDNWAELCARSLVTAGVRPGMRVQNAYGYGLFTGGLGFHYGAERLGTTVIPMSGGNTLRQIHFLESLQAEVLCCTPSFALHLADTREKMENQSRLSLRFGIFGAEPWTDRMRTQIERRLGLEAFDTYGLSEMTGPGVAQECSERDGLHIWEDSFLAEIVDPATGVPCRSGEEGELVITTLEKEAMPLVRYRTGDLTSLDPTPCRCGRTHARMARVRGRRDDMLIIRGVNLYPMEVEKILLEFDDVLPFYEMIITREGALDELTIRVECPASIVESVEAGEALGVKILHAFRSFANLTAHIQLVPPGTLPRSEGKALRVIDRRPH